MDGAETQLDLVEAGAAAYGVDVTVILDIIHVVEYVWKAAHVFHREASPEHPPRDGAFHGKPNTNRLLPTLGRSSGVRRVKPDAVPELPVLTATYCRPSTA